MIPFLHPESLWLLALLPLLAVWRGRKGRVAAVEYSNVAITRPVAREIRSRPGSSTAMRRLLVAALLLAGLARPQYGQGRSLPNEHRPENFLGLVGQFEFTAETIPTKTPSAATAALVAPEKPSFKSAPGRSMLEMPSRSTNPWSIASALVLSLIAAAAVYFVRRQRRVTRDPKNIQLEQVRAAVGIQIQIMESAVARGATLNFFTAARRALQIRLGHRWNLPPETITQAEINARMNGEAAHYWPVLEAADRVTYTGRVCTRAELRHWQASVARALSRLD